MNSDSHKKPPSTIFDILAVIRRRRRVIIICTLVAAVVAVFFSGMQSKLFEADATTLVQRQSLAKSLNNIVDPGSQPNEGPRVLEAQSNIATSPIVAAATLKAVPGTGLTVNELLDSVTITPDVNGDLLGFALTNASGPTAQRLVNEYVDQYVLYSTKVDAQAAEQAAATVRRGLNELNRQGLRGSTSYTELSKNLDSLRSIVSLSTPRAQVISKATDYTQIKPKPVVSLILGLVLGFAIGIGIAFVRDSLDGHIRSPEAIAEALDLPLISVIPLPSASREPWASEECLESCRVLQATIESALDADGGSSLLISGVAAPSDYANIAASLARISARSGRDTVLLDVGFRNPGLTRLLDAKGHAGASDLLANGATPSEASLAISEGLRFIPAGSEPETPGDLIGSRALRELIEELASRDTLVIVDAGAGLDASEAVSAASFVDNVLFVATTKDTEFDTLMQARQRLQLSTANPIGLAVIDQS